MNCLAKTLSFLTVPTRWVVAVSDSIDEVWDLHDPLLRDDIGGDLDSLRA